MATRLQFENSCDMGVFSKLTNAYCLVAIGGSENFYSAFETELAVQSLWLRPPLAAQALLDAFVQETKMGFSCPTPPLTKVCNLFNLSDRK
ncbi:eukaryotic translation initiation factor 6-like [Juglans regia]|uniref:Eukaryotic translation initiation factor 6-like n=1 Tax=Juglans regia TaxID=51240 RepID=A0A6P9E0I9_JUGRE|nr:eukaryotic translation initiation factor 6-like [Juglans regia]